MIHDLAGNQDVASGVSKGSASSRLVYLLLLLDLDC